jgi:hypothetical protein
MTFKVRDLKVRDLKVHDLKVKDLKGYDLEKVANDGLLLFWAKPNEEGVDQLGLRRVSCLVAPLSAGNSGMTVLSFESAIGSPS